MNNLVSAELIEKKIFLLRGEKVMLDRDLAELYGVETRALKQAVRRNILRFPGDFMFILGKKELEKWRSQIVMSNSDKMGLRHSPMAFTEQGVAMLSSVLKSEQAIQVNIAIMRTFTQLRRMLATHEELRRKIEEMEAKYDENFPSVFEVIKRLLAEDEKPRRRIGF